ncbi:hypothetical protein HCN44_000389 [Aphidius gifuensis]|uniref:Uncharacterized protein n=1 Tax=Aphidius gifuensis TaxID=684658 RepID=A0A835CN91_APHGI|nr:UPF0389 protein CG9231 [Aphidius gifuensis]KAF7990584.1 hypothetical protein HCN44_000389 [Aphidius gifuensis]
MLSMSKFFSAVLKKNSRNFGGGKVLRNVKPPTKKSSNSSNDSLINAHLHNPNSLEKRILVWFKKYPSIDQVPVEVPIDIVQSATSKFRIRIANVMMVMTIIGCIYTVLTGKKEKAEKLAEAGVNDAVNNYRNQIIDEYKEQKTAEKTASK